MQPYSMPSMKQEVIVPSKTKPQAKLMAACSHDAGYKKCPPMKVAKEFNQADKKTGILRGKTSKSKRGK
jgi:hypothetical protein